MRYYKSNKPKCSERLNILRYLFMSTSMIDIEKENKKLPLPLKTILFLLLNRTYGYEIYKVRSKKICILIIRL